MSLSRVNGVNFGKTNSIVSCATLPYDSCFGSGQVLWTCDGLDVLTTMSLHCRSCMPLTVGTSVLAYLGHAETGCRPTLRRKPKWFNREKGGFSNMLWSVLSKLRHVGQFGDPLHPFQSPVVLTWSCHWTLVGHGRESEVDIAQLFFTLNKVIAQVMYHSSSHSHKSCGDRQAAKRQVWVHWQS